MVIIFHSLFLMTYSDGKIPTMRPLEGERATKWRGGAVRQEPQMTLPQAGRRLAFRAAFALHLYTQPRTPFCRCAAFPLKGKQGIVPLTLAPPLGGEGHKVARGCCTARASNDTPSRQAAVWRSEQRLGQFVPLQMTVCCPQASSSRAGLPVVMSDRYSSLLKR